MKIKTYLKSSKSLVMDGAMGTYYRLKYDRQIDLVDLASLEDPQGVLKIHTEYLEAGAQVINTNTFSANSYKLSLDRPALAQLIGQSYRLASQAAQPFSAWVAADIGPLPPMHNKEEISPQAALDEYFFIIDTFLKLGCQVFNFETFTSPRYLRELAAYIKDKDPQAYVMTSFVLQGQSRTLHNHTAQSIVDDLNPDPHIDCLGFNCGTGPTHLYYDIKKLHLPAGTYSVVPNASYPEVIEDKIIYSQNPDYFADIMLDIHHLGIQVLGGCCGTTPDHIRQLKEALERPAAAPRPKRKKGRPPASPSKKLTTNPFQDKIGARDFAVAVELPPPRDGAVDRVLDMAARVKAAGADILTFSDSPLGRARTNPIALSARVKREVGICALPHLCCRDRNTIALKSDLLGAYIEDLSNILLITGDPIPQAARSEVSSIFNLNSFKLIELVAAMNKTEFIDQPFHIGAALNLNVPHKEKALARMARKRALGADFFMTQPIFEKEVIDFLAALAPDPDRVILAGIMPIVNYRNARFLQNEIPGIHLPKEVMDRFNAGQTKDEAQKAGVDLALETITSLSSSVQGIYLVTPLERIDMIEDIIRAIRKTRPDR